MKKIVLMMAGALCIGAAAFAQEPTQQPTPQTPQTQQPTEPTQQSRDTTAIQQSQPTQQPSPAATSTPAYRKDMTQIQAGDVPTGLRSTLDRPQFKGWENGAVYSNVDKSVFVVEIKDEVEGRMKAYRFDANGKPITDN